MNMAATHYTGWRAAGAAVMGRSHGQKEIPCQDKIFSVSRDPFHAITLADGAGSCPLSHEGAALVTELTACYLSSHMRALAGKPPGEWAALILNHLTRNLASRAKALNAGSRDLSSTLLFAVVYGDNYVAGHIGDGVIGCLKKDGLHLVSEPESGEFINTTFFVTTPGALQHFRLYRGSGADVEGFFLMSDGAAESLFDRKQKSFSKALIQMLSWLDGASRKEVCDALDANMKTFMLPKTTDDCSLIVLKKSTFTAPQLAVLPEPVIEEALQAQGHSHSFSSHHAGILNAWHQGHRTSREISRICGLSVRTVQRHLRYARERGLI
jgi:hypothetical protein